MAATPFQINAQVASGVVPGAATLTVSSALGTAQQSITVSPNAPAIFLVSGVQPAVTNQDNSLNTSTNPALRGNWIVIYATGLGIVSGTGALQQVTTPVSVMIGGAAITPAYSGISPGSPNGVYQVNVQLPSAMPPGLALPIYLQQGAAVSNTVMLAVE